MKTETTQVTKLLISDLMGEPYKLDPVSAILEDFEPGRGRLILECAGESWSAWWSAMSGRTVAQFVCDCSADYIIGCIASQVRESRFSGDALYALAKRALIARRWGKGDYWEYGDRLEKQEAAELWSELDELRGVDRDQACWQHSDLLTRLFGEEWWHMASRATVPNPAYHYLQRLVAAVQAGLLESGLAQPKKGKVAP
ncbi:hypothetical protein [Aquipseudomonas campi]